MKLTIVLSLLVMFASSAFATEKVWKGSATLIVKKEHLEDFKIAVGKITKPTLKEKGCISYQGYQVLDDEGKETNRFEFHETWVSKEAMLIDHKENAVHMKKFFKDIKADTDETYLESFSATGKYVYVIE